MPFPNVNSEFETLLEPTRIWLFGKPFKSIRYVPEEMWGLRQGSEGAEKPTDPLKPEDLVPSKSASTPHDTSKWTPDFQALLPEEQRRASEQRAKLSPKEEEAAMREEARRRLSEEPREYRANEFKRYRTPTGDRDIDMPPRRIERKLRQDDQRFARIYSFSFEGHYYRLPRPLLFLLSGPGQRPDEDRKAQGMFERHVAFTTKLSGTVGREWQFSDDIRVWAVDRKDLAVCLDVEVANYHELLLNSMVARGGTSSRGDMVSRGDVVGRGDGGTVSRGAGAGAFRGDMIGPHQNW
jgi:hypothetical protein